MSRVLQVLEIFKICICHVFEFCYLPKVTSTLSKRLSEHAGDTVWGRRYSSCGKKDKYQINCSGKYGCVTVCYFWYMLEEGGLDSNGKLFYAKLE